MCNYLPAYSMSYCKNPSVEGSVFCKEHMGKQCTSCNAQATHECSYCGQFVCGAPLCDNCEGYEEQGKPSGAWGFLNHKHKVK
jgi:hypothetical protein